jgi:hypothetical protein
LVLEPVILLVRLTTLPDAAAVTGEPESPLKALASAEAIVEDELPFWYLTDSGWPLTVMDTVPLS